LYRISDSKHEPSEKCGTSDRWQRSHRKKQQQMIANARHATDNSGGREEMRLDEFLWEAEERLSHWD
jgi:hypothetical protein